MTDIILLILCGLLLGASLYREEINRRERKDLLRMIKAKDLDEVTRAEIVEKVKPEPEMPPEYKPIDALSDDEFFEALEKGKNGGK